MYHTVMSAVNMNEKWLCLMTHELKDIVTHTQYTYTHVYINLLECMN